MFHHSSDKVVQLLKTQLHCFLSHKTSLTGFLCAPCKGFNTIQDRWYIYILSAANVSHWSPRETLLGDTCVTSEHTIISDWESLHNQIAMHTIAVFPQWGRDSLFGHKDEMKLRCHNIFTLNNPLEIVFFFFFSWMISEETPIHKLQL